jgi:hypothetical protein
MNAIDQSAEEIRNEIIEAIVDHVSADDLYRQGMSEACFKAAVLKEKLAASERKIAALERELNLMNVEVKGRW